MSSARRPHDPPHDDPWNVLVITSDEHNAKMLCCAGHPFVKTPYLDRLASQGMRFTNAYCAQPICAPTRQTFITGTGLYSFEHGQYGNGYVFDKRHPTWAHHFKACGYTTACIGKMHTNNDDHHYGFDYRFSKSMVSDEIKDRRYVLYDLEADPDETRNLAYDLAHAAIVREHEAAFAAFFATLRKPLFPVRLAKDDPEADRKGAGS